MYSRSQFASDQYKQIRVCRKLRFAMGVRQVYETLTCNVTEGDSPKNFSQTTYYFVLKDKET